MRISRPACCAAARSWRCHAAQPASLGPVPIPEAADRFRRRPVTIAGSGDPAAQTGVAVHIYAANRSMEARYLLQRRWRTAARPATGAPAHRHRTRHARCRAGGDLRDPARHQVPRRSARWPLARVRLRELRRAVPAARTRPDRRQRSGQCARFSGARGGFEDLDAECRIVAKFLGKLWSRRSITRRSTWWRGTATTRRTNTIWRASTASTR